MVVPELRPWRAAGPRLARIADAVRPRLARTATAVRPRLVRLGRTVSSQVTRPKTWQYTAGAATAGLALAVGVVTAAGPWDSSGQRTAERDRAAAERPTGGADHGRNSATTDRAPRPAPSAATVLTGLGGATGGAKPAPRTKALAKLLDPLLDAPALGDRQSAAVVDITTGKRLYGDGAGTALTPASTTKIATAAAVLSALGPDHRLTTRAALEPDTGELVLVGGGDPTLTAREDAKGFASLRALAEDTAAALKKDGVREVTLSYDTTLYAGDELHPIGVDDNIARITALMADEARADDSTSGHAPRVPEPAAEAARTFADLLKDHGIKTTPPGPSKATNRARTLAEVTSPPLSVLVERMLTNSDNDIAEALARHTALATGERPDLEGAGKAIKAELTKLGLPMKGTEFQDGSGLDRDNLLTADLLTSLLTKSADPAHPELRPILTGLPVAGFTGTLTTRYESGAAGLVRAKTGTLTGVNALAGTVVDEDGHLLAFAFLATGTPNTPEARSALDEAATALAACGCT
ncbi:D-alanyl-D-alanine carboxypeptidase/D-alanyl-D-alanine-endopeptidase [Streptomyces sp. FZ201]|uniref:D-alanyl-D-alanine carboxypeptidase/D-alanyl-D-alanine endopeptidase n=1 Tax=Streptomyces sp. FZ201 TaxID=3057122 RepID=UPI0021C0C6C5|nr:D-alanyl-D-alanine carboxypeptidase/D-alanyl-D-alanine-endopeptidase [Streptomyces sp. FZ201]